MNILIVSSEAWCDTNNGGNVLSNIFSAFADADIAQIYCSGEMPRNSVCRKYFQITESLLFSPSKGRKLVERDYSSGVVDEPEVVETTIKHMVPSVFREAALLARECLWSAFNWKSKELEKFIREFKPDIIFAPCYSYFHVSKVALYVKEIAQCPMISYISDDNYSLKQLRFSPCFWINRLVTRKWIRRHFAACSLIYTMTEAQKKEYTRLLGRPMKVLCKSADFEYQPKAVHNPICFIYAGGLYLNRWKILAEISRILGELNGTEVKAQLHIFSGSKLSARQEGKINDGRNSFLHPQISYGELMKRYKEADIAIHAEAFDLKSRLSTRLSFSTKIIDCMSSGCAMLAVGPAEQAGISYLKEHDAAVCVNDLKRLQGAVEMLIKDTDQIEKYAYKAARLGKMKHVKLDIDRMLRQDFHDIIAND